MFIFNIVSQHANIVIFYFQRRVSDSVDFYRDWQPYVDGFGDADGNFWLGLELIHQLTLEPSELKVTMEDDDGVVAIATYSSFSLGSAVTFYTLHVSGFSGVRTGDSLAYHDGAPFSARDQDHDTHGGGHCSQMYLSAWWHKACTKITAYRSIW